MALNEQLLKSARKGDTEIVELLIKKGADVNARDKDGKTVLMQAAWNANVETVKLVIQKGADVNAKDNYNETTLMQAAYCGYGETVELLIKKGADPIYACFYNSIYIVKDTTRKVIINRILEEKPELFTEKEKLMIDLYYNPGNIPPDRKKEVIEALRESQKKGSITKTEALELFNKLNETWNNKIGEL